MKLSFLYGITAGDWAKLLRDNSFDVDRSRLGAVALISVMSVFNSALALLDRGVDLSGVAVRPPLFILGHWRSGTTHLQNLLSQDPQLVAPTTYQVANPRGFLRAEAWHKPLIAPLVPRRRPQDAMAMGVDTAQEEEVGLAAMCPYTPYTGWAFPRRELHYRRYLTFEDTALEERAAFLDALDLLVRKLSLRSPGRAVVLKSPGHTARVPMLLERWPNARFVIIHRDPYEVFQSSVHLYQTWWERFAFLQDPPRGGLEERVLALYEQMHRRFFETEALLPAGRTSTVGYGALVQDPIGELRRIYGDIGLEGLPEEALRVYVAGLEGYHNNRYAPLEPRWRDEVARRWAPSFDRWGYGR